MNLGNTTVAAAVWSGGRLARVKRVPTSSLGQQKLFAAGQRASFAAVASVVPEQERALERALRAAFGQACPIRYLNRDLSPILKLRVKNPKAVGADRLAGALAAHRRFGAAITVDFGTAITVNAVNSRGEFLGGTILPGSSLATQALFSGTARVKVKPPRRAAHPPGRSTGEAVAAGATVGLAGAVDRLIEETLKSLGGKATLVATGGGAKLIAPLCRHKLIVLPNLVLEGLAIAALEALD